MATPEVKPYALAREQGELVWWSGHAMTFKCRGPESGGSFGLIETKLHRGYEPPQHYHREDDEFYYLLDGEMTFKAGDELYELVTGGFVFLPKGIPHGFAVRGTGEAHVLMWTSPSGPRHSGALFFDHGLRGEGQEPPFGVKPIDPETMSGLLSTYNIEVVGPPLPVVLDAPT